MLVLVDSLGVCPIHATIPFLLCSLRLSLSGAAQRVLQADLDIIAGFIQNHGLIPKVRLWRRAIGFCDVLLAVQRETTGRIWACGLTLDDVKLLIQLATIECFVMLRSLRLHAVIYLFGLLNATNLPMVDPTCMLD